MSKLKNITVTIYNYYLMIIFDQALNRLIIVALLRGVGSESSKLS